MGFRYGKKPPRRLMGVPALSDFMAPAASWPAVKPWGWEYALPDGDLNILGNDVVGNCGPCGALHLLQTQAASLKNQILTPTLEDALALYSAVGGYDPNIPLNPDGSNPTDQGVDLLTLLQYWKNTGITVGGVKHTIRGFASLDLSSVAQMRYAGYLFGGLYLGINCPRSAEDDTSDWQYVPGSPVAGGHCINLAGEGSLGTHIQSWGMNIPTSWDFLLHQLDEGYVVLTDIWVDAQDEAPSGVDINGLLAAMSRIGATGG